MFNKFWKAYENDYKKLMIIPLVLFTIFSGIILYTKFTTGEFFAKDISLKGGTSITFYSDNEIPNIEESVNNVFGSNSQVIIIRDNFGGFKGYDLRVSEELGINQVMNELSIITGKNITENEFSISSQSASISSGFFNEFLIIIGISFILMGGVAIYYFKSPITAITIALVTLSNVIIVIGSLNLLNQSLSIAGIGAILMLLGLGTDTDILLASTVLNKQKSEYIPKLKRLFYTESTICLAAITNALVIFLLTNIDTIKHISLILLIGTTADLFSTLFLSSGIMRYYNDKKMRHK